MWKGKKPVKPWIFARKLNLFSVKAKPKQENSVAKPSLKAGEMNHVPSSLFFPSHICFLLKTYIFYLFIFRERGKEGEREGEKHWCVRETLHRLVASCKPLTGDPAWNPGLGADQEWNGQPLNLQAGTQSTEPHQPGPQAFSLFLTVIPQIPNHLHTQLFSIFAFSWPHSSFPYP